MGILQSIEQEQIRHEINFRPGDTVRVHVRIKEGDKERIQMFEGVVIAMHRGGSRASFTVRKVSYSVGVERVFPLHSPTVEKVEVIQHGKVRRAKLYFLRQRRGKKARLKVRDTRKKKVKVAPGTPAVAKAAAKSAAPKAEAAPAE